MMNTRAQSSRQQVVPMPAILPFKREMADDVAGLMHDAFVEHRSSSPRMLLSPPDEWTPVEELAVVLGGDTVCPEASFVATEGGRAVSAAIATSGEGGAQWWRITTDPACRRSGLASSCMEAGESAMRDAGQQIIATGAVVDSRWTAAGALLSSRGYSPDEPEKRNITMRLDEWVPRDVAFPDGYELATLREDDVPEWSEVKSRIFGWQSEPEWFLNRFMSRPDYDPSGWLVVRHEGSIVGISGVLAIRLDRDPERLHGAQIEYVGVLDEHRGRKLGRLLVTECLNWAYGRDSLPVILLTQPFRVPAVTLYESLGFRTLCAWQSYVKPLQ
jgi:GNAT superfamily N-acetyltransferase